MLHRIRHQILELELPREAGAIAMQRRASRVFQEQVLPKLDAAFSRIAPADRVVRIQELTVDLGNIDESGWEEAFVEACVAQISQQVAECAFEVASNRDNNVETLNRDAENIDILRFFLEHGFMPWFASGMTLPELVANIQKAGIRSVFVPYAQSWRTFFQQKPDALQRLLWQFEDVFYESILEITLHFPQGSLNSIFRKSASDTHRQPDAKKKRRWLQMMLTEGDLSKSAPLNTVEAHWVKRILAMEDNGKQPARPAPSTDAAIASTSRKNQTVEQEKREQRNASIKHTIEGISVDNAGLVLLGAYLPVFFKKNGLNLTGQEDEAAIFQAVHALHFLATGQSQPEEPTLILPKILCGLALDAPVPQDVELPAEIQTEADHLLQAIIHNWGVLKNTSPDGLRSGFLMRKGILSWQEDRQMWLLQVERQGQDLLLDRLPWTFGTVKLPWMENMIQTEW